MNVVQARIFRNDDHSITFSIFNSSESNFYDITLDASTVVGFCHEEGKGEDFKIKTDGKLLLDEAVEYIETRLDFPFPNVKAGK